MSNPIPIAILKPERKNSEKHAKEKERRENEYLLGWALSKDCQGTSKRNVSGLNRVHIENTSDTGQSTQLVNECTRQIQSSGVFLL